MIYKQIVYKIFDLTDVPLAFITSMALFQIKDILGIIGLFLTILYTLWKWRKEYFESKNNKKHTK